MNMDTLRGSIKSTKLSAKDIMIPTNKIQLSPQLDEHTQHEQSTKNSSG